MCIAALQAVAADVPVAVQLPLFVNVWRMDRNFTPHDPVALAILYEETNVASTSTKNAVLAWAHDKRGMRIDAIPMDNPAAYATLQTLDVDVFYLAPMRAADIERVVAIARRRRIRTMTGVREYVMLGASVAIGVRDDRPRIIINLEAARAEGAAYPAQLLQLAEIIQGR
jgi:hypothetical protein